MIELVLSVCSILHGARCDEKALVFTDVSLITCMVGAQPYVARWSEEHPNYRVHRWTCRPAGQHAKA